MAISRKMQAPALLLLFLLTVTSVFGYKPEVVYNFTRSHDLGRPAVVLSDKLPAVVYTSSQYYDFDVLLGGPEAVLADNQPKLVIEGGHVALAPLRHHAYEMRKRIQPRRWIHHKVFGEDGDLITVKITDDDMYCTGYADKNGRWSYLKGWGSLYSAEDRELEFGEQYSELLKGLPGDGGHDKLVQLPLGKDELRKAINRLANNDLATADQRAEALAFAQVEVMICEALRFKKIRATLRANWETGAVVYLTMLEAESTVTWGKVSYCMQLYHRTGFWGKDSDGRYKGNCQHEDFVGEAISFQQAHETVNLVLRNIILLGA